MGGCNDLIDPTNLTTPLYLYHTMPKPTSNAYTRCAIEQGTIMLFSFLYHAVCLSFEYQWGDKQ